MTSGIIDNELQDHILTVFRDENGELLFEITHVSQLDWNRKDFKSIGMDEVFRRMTPA